ncbi:MAG: LicD family protein [Bacteroidales bacterium]|nr:LicD family protein [Bacteroidales bacterium]
MNVKETPLSIEEIHKELLNPLKKITEICNNEGIKYFLAYGSLIGAVRHKGFIPWDDDLDIIMMRPDYERFIKYCEEHKERIYPYCIMTYTNTPGYPYAIARFCDVVNFRMQKDDTINMGLFIDVYPFDIIKPGKERIIRFKKGIFNRLWFYAHYNKVVKSESFIKNIGKYFFYFCSRFVTEKWTLKHLSNIAKKYSDSNGKYVGSLIWDAGLKTFDKEWFSKTNECEFENVMVNVPYELDKVLRTSYGNYMQLPPIEKQIPTHEYILYKIQ